MEEIDARSNLKLDDKLENSDNDSTSSSDSEDSDDENNIGGDSESFMEACEESLTKMEEAKKTLAQTPYNYQGYISLIENAKTAGELDELRSARETFSNHFPLAPTLWLDWIKDEKDYLQGTGADRHDMAKVKDLFNRAVVDYTSFDVWYEYCQWYIGFSDDYDAIRSVFERALGAVGLQANKACLLWDMYREFEMALHTTLKQAYSKSPATELGEEMNRAKERVHKLFRRVLALPLAGIEQTKSEYDQFVFEEGGMSESKHLQNHLMTAYSSAVSRLEKLLPLEDELESAELPKLDAFRTYIKQELEWGDPGRIQLIYDRALIDNCLNADLWLEYTKWHRVKLRIPSNAIPLYARAVRNVPWVTLLWTDYLLCLERAGESRQRQQETFEAALKTGGLGAQAQEGISLWLTYIYCQKRAADIEANAEGAPKEAQNRPIPDYSLVAQAFTNGAENLKESFEQHPGGWDPTASYRRAWAMFAARFALDMATARAVWESVLSDCNIGGRYASVWLEYIAIERRYGAPETARKLFFKAVNSVSDQPELVCDAFLAFEREEGSLTDLDAATERVDSQLARVHERQSKEQSQRKQHKPGGGKIAHPVPNSSGRLENQQTPSGNRKERRQAMHQQNVSSNAAPGGRKQQKGKKTFAPPPAADNAPIKPYVPAKRRRAGGDWEQPSTEANNEETSKKPKLDAEQSKLAAPDSSNISNGNNFVTPAIPAATRITPNNSVSNLSDMPTADDTEPATSSGSDTSTSSTMDLVMSKLKQFKEAVGTTNNAGGGAQPTNTADSHNQEKKVFISNLDFRLKQDELKDHLVAGLPEGAVRNVTLMLGTGGRSKGFAYVELSAPELVPLALALDRTLIKSRPMFVSVCNPSRRGPSGFSFAGGLEKHKLFVRGLALETTQSDLEEYFGKFTGFKQIRLIMHKSGRSKCAAYIEFETEELAKSALLATDGQELHGKQLNVAFSNPPAKKGGQPTVPSAPPSSRQVPGGARSTEPMDVDRGHKDPSHHPAQPFIGRKPPKITGLMPPRAAAVPMVAVGRKAPVMKPKQSLDGDQSGGAGDESSSSKPTPSLATDLVQDPDKTAQSAKLSNEDFRKRFFKP